MATKVIVPLGEHFVPARELKASLHIQNIDVTLKALLAAISVVFLLFSIAAGMQATKAQVSTITINPDGSVTPSTSNVQRAGDFYLVTADLNCSLNIQKDNIVLDGVNHTLQGPSSSQNSVAITLMASNVTVEDFHISGWRAGVYGAFNNNTITNNEFSDNFRGITVYACNYVVSQNFISGSSDVAVFIDSGAPQPEGDNNLLIKNQLVNNNWAFDIMNSNGTIITENNVTGNSVILTLGSLQANISDAGFHMLYLNNFVNNSKILHIPFGGPTVEGFSPVSPAGKWDNGAFGNYWSDYSSEYPNASEIDHSGIGDTPYLIENSITWSRDYANGTHLKGIAALGIATDNYPLMAPNNGSKGSATKNSPFGFSNLLTPTLSPSAVPSPSTSSSSAEINSSPRSNVPPVSTQATEKPTITPIPTQNQTLPTDFITDGVALAAAIILVVFAVLVVRQKRKEK